jgi:hypothetical protein
MYDKDDMKPGAMKKVAAMKAKNKMSKTGKMLDDMEMKQAPRKPFLETMKKGKKTTKTTKVPAFFETMKKGNK